MPDPQESVRAERFRPLRIWRTLDPERKRMAAAAFWKSEAVKPPEIEMAVTSLATALRFRPQSIRTAPLARRAAWLAGHHAIPEPLAAALLYAYHLAHKVEMMARFLDAIGVAHEKGKIQEEVKAPARPAIEEGIEILLKEFDRRDVVIYLETLVGQDEETWGEVAAVVQERLGG